MSGEACLNHAFGSQGTSGRPSRWSKYRARVKRKSLRRLMNMSSVGSMGASSARSSTRRSQRRDTARHTLARADRRPLPGSTKHRRGGTWAVSSSIRSSILSTSAAQRPRNGAAVPAIGHLHGKLSEERIKLIDGAVGFDSGAVFFHALSAYERSGTAVAGGGVDFSCHHIFLKNGIFGVVADKNSVSCWRTS